jgi:NADH-quinone oxidoreductase subunit C
MANKLEKATAVLIDRLNAQPCDLCRQEGLIVTREHLVEAAQILRDELGFNLLSDITAVDYWPEGSPVAPFSARFHVVYIFSSIPAGSAADATCTRLSLRVPVDEDTSSVPTVEGVYPTANWFEREIWDMFGIDIEGHSDLRRLLMPRDWEGHPLRKDFPLGYEEPQFTFNFDDIARRKPHPKEADVDAPSGKAGA